MPEKGATDRLVGDGGPLGPGRVDKLAPDMGHAGDLADAAGAVEVVEPGIAVHCPSHGLRANHEREMILIRLPHRPRRKTNKWPVKGSCGRVVSAWAASVVKPRRMSATPAVPLPPSRALGMPCQAMGRRLQAIAEREPDPRVRPLSRMHACAAGPREPGSCGQAADQPGQRVGVVAADDPQIVAARDLDLDRASRGPGTAGPSWIFVPGPIEHLDRQESAAIAGAPEPASGV
jgi:hypothetical protein